MTHFCWLIFALNIKILRLKQSFQECKFPELCRFSIKCWSLQILISCSFAFLGGPQDAINLRVEKIFKTTGYKYRSCILKIILSLADIGYLVKLLSNHYVTLSFENLENISNFEACPWLLIKKCKYDVCAWQSQMIPSSAHRY